MKKLDFNKFKTINMETFYYSLYALIILIMLVFI